MNRLMILAVLVVTLTQIRAEDNLKFKDAAATKIFTAPKAAGGIQFEGASKYSSSMVAKLDAPGIKSSQFNKATVVSVAFNDSSSGSGDKVLEFKLGDDPKYTDGASSVKFAKPGLPGISLKQNIEYTVTLKITDGQIALTYASKYLPLYAQQYINFGSIPGGVKFPEGSSEHSKTVTGTVTIGSFVKTLKSLSYKVVSNNKKAKDSNLWSGTASGSITLP